MHLLRNPLNDLVDFAAKQAALRDSPSDLMHTLGQAFREGVLDWLWAACHLRRALPRVGEDGFLHDTTEPPRTAALADQVPLQHGNPSQATRFDVRMATYNCLSAQSLESREGMDKHFARLRVSVVGLQETRTDLESRQESCHYHIVGSESERGQLGTQLWLAKRIPAAWAGNQPLYWEADSLSVVLATPRILLALLLG